MSKVGFVTDSTTYLPQEFLERYPIRVAPATIIWSGQELRDGVDILPGEFYTRLETAQEMPTTSQASPIAIKTAFEELLAEGYEVIGAFITSKLSGTFASARQAKAMLPGKVITLIDTLTGSMGLGWPILAAARAAARGASLAECKAVLERALKHVGILLTVDTLEYLHRGGRIGAAQHYLGDLLNLKPILEVVNGAFTGIERVRTVPKALDRLVVLLENRVGGRAPLHLGVLHANAPERAQQLLQRAVDLLHPIETVFAEVSPAVGVHLGPGTVGFAFMAGIE
jgi:DegV family protein with EDD domain